MSWVQGYALESGERSTGRGGYSGCCETFATGPTGRAAPPARTSPRDAPTASARTATSRQAPAFRADGNARSEEHTSELQSLMRISYAVFCLKKKTTKNSKHYVNTKIT